MAAISVVGIRMTARTQVIIGIIEYTILIVLAVWGLTWVLSHHAGTVRITSETRQESWKPGSETRD
jgi:amino acid transporter